ncbi:MAG TPA: APC family permease [bacterium]
MMHAPHEGPLSLRRALGLGALIAYGVGDILGAGIYALVGKVVGVAAGAAWLSFAVAFVVALLSALSYAELARRFPRSAGEAYYCERAFGRAGPALFIGWLVLCSGLVSMAAVSRAVAGYVGVVLPAGWQPAVILLFFLGLLWLNVRGIHISSRANLVCLAVELAGLAIVLAAGAAWLSRAGSAAPPAAPAAPVPWTAILQGGALAFFAFIGFEDMVNIAEEVRSPQRILPAALLTALSVCGLLYIAVAAVATAVVPAPALASSSAPLLEVVRTAAPAVPAGLFVVIALFAVTNTALANYVMASRLVYGLARQGLIPAWLGAVHALHRTPHRAILALGAAGAALALSGTLTALAGATSLLILGVFAAVNASLLAVKRRPDDGEPGFSVPGAVPVLGAAASLGLMAFTPPDAWVPAGVLALCGAVLTAASGARRRG